MVGWHCLNIKPKDREKDIVFNFQFDSVTLAWKDVFIKLLANTNVIETLDKSNKIVMWIEWKKILPKNCSGSVKESILKHENASFFIFGYKHFFVKTLVQISTSTEVNHLLRKELYLKQNGFKFI